MVDTSTYSTDWFRATTLAERIDMRRAARVSESGIPEISDLARKLLEQWRNQAPFNRGESFNQRLASDGISEEFLLHLLDEPEEVLQSRFGAPPKWLTDIMEAFSNPVFVEEASNLEEESGAPSGPAGFLQLISPMIKLGISRFQSRMTVLQDLYSELPFAPTTIVNKFTYALVQRLTEIVTRTMILELNVARVQGQLVGETQEERFQSFVQRLRNKDVTLNILKEYPVLTRLVSVCIDNWVVSNTEFLERLAADAQPIKEAFCASGHLGQLEEVSIGTGDLHRGGRSVTIGKFSSGITLVYKPRPLSVDEHFQKLLEWLNQRGNHPPFRILRVLNQGAYGWVEFVSAEGCKSEAEIRRFFERQGGYLALLYTLEAVDCHFENLIASGEHPVLIDLESLFHPRMDIDVPGRSASQASDMVEHSVLRVGLLPQRFWVNGKSDGVVLSALGATGGQLSPTPSMYLEGVGTDSMRVARKHLPLLGGQNQPSLNGSEVDVVSYTDSVIKGFTGLYRLLLDCRDELLAPGGPIDAFAKDEVRVILRPTNLYGLFLRDGFHPDVLRDALDRDRLFDRLWMGSDILPYMSRVIPSEREDLWNGDIPLFSTHVDSRHLWDSSGQCIDNFFRQSGIDIVRQCIGQLNERDLDQQLWFIRASFTALSTGEGSRGKQGYAVFVPQSSLDAARFTQASVEIGNRLESLAFQTEDDVSWVGVTLVNNRVWSLQALGQDLYNGIPGVALFLAYLGNITKERRFTELASRAISASLLRFEKAKGSLRSIGGFDGWGGAIYTLTHLGTLWQRADLLDQAQEFMGLLPELVPADDRFDIISGSAGCIGGLLSLYRITGSPRALEVAVQCGDHLIARATRMEEGIGWLQESLSSKPLTGYAHGNSGIAWALLELAAVSNEDRFKRAAEDAVLYERSLFSSTQNNWPDLRDPELLGRSDSENSENYMVAWCHGAAGIGYARLKSLEHDDNAEIRLDTLVALDTTLKQGFGHTHSICHGDLGNLDFALEASRILDIPSLPSQVDQLAAMILESADRYAWLCGVPLNIETPGLMTGLSGIGYEMLRLAYPMEVPSILMMEPPKVSPMG